MNVGSKVPLQAGQVRVVPGFNSAEITTKLGFGIGLGLGVFLGTLEGAHGNLPGNTFSEQVSARARYSAERNSHTRRLDTACGHQFDKAMHAV